MPRSLTLCKIRLVKIFGFKFLFKNNRKFFRFTGLFEINPTSGVVYLIGALDFESNKHLEMLVSAKGFTGGEDVARFVVKVSDSNDHSPVFKQHIYEGVVFENAPSGTIVASKGFSDVPLTVLATDTDTGPAGLVSYRISDAWAQNYFEIDYRYTN